MKKPLNTDTPEGTMKGIVDRVKTIFQEALPETYTHEGKG